MNIFETLIASYTEKGFVVVQADGSGASLRKGNESVFLIKQSDETVVTKFRKGNESVFLIKQSDETVGGNQ